MTESLISHWTDAQCRKVLERLLAEQKVRVAFVQKMCLSNNWSATWSLSRNFKIRNFKTESKAQAWLDQQWKDYVDGMKPITTNRTCEKCDTELTKFGWCVMCKTYDTDL